MSTPENPALAEQGREETRRKAVDAWKEANRKMLQAQSEAYFALFNLLDAHGLLSGDI